MVERLCREASRELKDNLDQTTLRGLEPTATYRSLARCRHRRRRTVKRTVGARQGEPFDAYRDDSLALAPSTSLVESHQSSPGGAPHALVDELPLSSPARLLALEARRGACGQSAHAWPASFGGTINRARSRRGGRKWWLGT